jgi:hypothetical protein
MSASDHKRDMDSSISSPRIDSSLVLIQDARRSTRRLLTTGSRPARQAALIFGAGSFRVFLLNEEEGLEFGTSRHILTLQRLCA